jgi:hypothetical protein
MCLAAEVGESSFGFTNSGFFLFAIVDLEVTLFGLFFPVVTFESVVLCPSSH